MTVYYVDPVNGSDAAAGTATGTAWRTLNKAKNTVVAGDTVNLRGGNYDESIALIRSGTAALPITWQAYNDEVPILRGQTGVWPIINIVNFSYNIFINIQVSWTPVSPVANKRFDWILVSGSSAVGNQFQGCTFFRDGDIADIWAAGWNDRGARVVNARQTRFYQCRIYGVNMGIVVGEGTDLDTLIEECHIGETGQSNIVLSHCSGIPRRCWIKNCTLDGSYIEDGIQWTQNLAFEGTDLSNRGTYVSGCIIRNANENALDFKGCKYIVIDSCIMYGVVGSADGPTNGWNRNSFSNMTVGANAIMDHIIVRRCISYDCPTGFKTEDTNVAVYNNTFVACNRDYSGNPSTVGTPANKLLFTGIRHVNGGVGHGYKNNIFVGMDDGPLGLIPANGDIDIDYNCYDDFPYTGTPSQIWTQAASFAAWKSALALEYSGGNDANSFVVADVAAVDFVNVPSRPIGAHTAYDFGIENTSPCKETGGPLTTTVGSGTNSSTISVKNATYFFDGFGIAGVTGDTITVNGQTRIITAVDYEGNELTVSEPVTYTPGQAVYFGVTSTPDIGAPSFGETGGGGGSGTAGTGSAIVTRVACNTSTGNQTITLPVTMANAPKAVKFIVSSAVTDDTAAANAIMGIGFATATAAFAIATNSQDAVNPSNTARRTVEGSCVLIVTNTGTIDGEASWVSMSTTEVVINWTNAPGSAWLLTVIAYDCAEAYLTSFAIPQALNATTTISPGFEFDLAYFATHERGIPANVAALRIAYAVASYDGTTLKQASWNQFVTDDTSPTEAVAHLSTTYIIAHLSATGSVVDALQLSVSGEDVIATTKVSGWGDADGEGIGLFLRFDNIGVYTGIIDSRTVTGANTYGDPAFSPSHVEIVATLAEATGTGYANALAGAWGIGVADTARQYSVSTAHEFNQVTSDTQSISDDRLVNLPLDSGAAGIVASLSAMESAGPELNFTTVTATAKKWIFVALETPTAGAAGTDEGYSEDYGTFTLYINLAGTDEGYSEDYGPATQALAIVAVLGTDEGYSEDYGTLASTTPGITAVIRPLRTYPDSQNVAVHVHEPLMVGNQFIMNISDQITSYEHELTALGGYWTATVKISDRQGRLEDWFERGLGRRIVTYNPEGGVVWEGFVNRITLNLGGLTKSVGPVLNIANKVRLVYSFIDSEADNPIIGLRATTDWAEDTDSQAKWGILERVLSSGGTTPTDADSIRDDYLRENRNPETDESQNIGGSLSEPQIDLECLGYVHFLQTYTYNSTTFGATTLSAKLASVLTAEPNDFLSHETQFISANALAVAAFDNDNRIAWNVVKELTSKGDASDNRYLFGVYADRLAHYAPVVDQIDYLQYLSDPEQKVTTPSGQRIPPWDVRPGKWIFSPDFLVGRVPDTTALRDDPRVEFIEGITYRAPWQLALRGSKVRRLDQKLAKLGLAGIGG